MRRFTTGKNEQDMRLSRFVQRVARKLPPSAMYKAFRNRRIKVNGRRAAPDALLCAGDVIELYLNDEFFEENASRPQTRQAGKSRFSIQVIMRMPILQPCISQRIFCAIQTGRVTTVW